MRTGPAFTTILVLCDHNALYSAIELALTTLPGLTVQRLPAEPGQAAAAGTQTAPQAEPAAQQDAAMVIVAAAALTSDPFTMLSDAGLLAQVGETPILILSERPTRAESDDRITYLNFPFDMDQLTTTVQAILDRRTKRLPTREQSHGR